jgi:hypothetical protein
MMLIAASKMQLAIHIAYSLLVVTAYRTHAPRDTSLRGWSPVTLVVTKRWIITIQPSLSELMIQIYFLCIAKMLRHYVMFKINMQSCFQRSTVSEVSWLSVPGNRSRNPGFDSQCYQIFLAIVIQERGSLNLVRITEDLLEWESSNSGLENRN